MSRPADLSLKRQGALCALGLLAAVLIGPNALPAQDAAEGSACAPELRLETAQDGLVDLRVTAPCQPYIRVDIAYGPFVLTEETSHEGHVDLRLPRVAAVPEAAAQIGEAVLFAALPASADPVPGYIALIWSGEADLSLALPGPSVPAHRLRLGFPFGDQARRAEIVVLDAADPAPPFADIAIGAQQCATSPIRAALLTPDAADRMPLILPAGCDAAGGLLRLALPGTTGAP